MKLLYGLYCEKKVIRDVDNVLDTMMSKIKNGNANIIIELIRMFDESVKVEDNSLGDIEEIVKECSDYQNKMLRNHIGKMHQILRDSLFEVKRDVYHAKQEIIYNRDKIAH